MPAIINTNKPDGTTYTVRFSPDGSQFVMGEDYGAVRFFAYPLATPPAPLGNLITFAGGDSVSDIAFAPSGKYVAIGGAFSVKQLSIYDAATHDGARPGDASRRHQVARVRAQRQRDHRRHGRVRLRSGVQLTMTSSDARVFRSAASDPPSRNAHGGFIELRYYGEPPVIEAAPQQAPSVAADLRPPPDAVTGAPARSRCPSRAFSP